MTLLDEQVDTLYRDLHQLYNLHGSDGMVRNYFVYPTHLQAVLQAGLRLRRTFPVFHPKPC